MSQEKERIAYYMRRSQDLIKLRGFKLHMCLIMKHLFQTTEMDCVGQLSRIGPELMTIIPGLQRLVYNSRTNILKQKCLNVKCRSHSIPIEMKL